MQLILDKEKYPLKLKIGQLLQLEKMLSDNLGNISQRLALGNWSVADVQAIIYLALCGGGLNEVKAQEISDSFFDKEPILTAVNACGSIIATALTGAVSDEVKEDTSKKKAKR
ncbi:gene transfer agent family protein [Bartonella sp. DGB1]|uniref:gene transfer agent family protein n=1 Tax=Bartonella sp. DGB1 TaxID=3239807 RepID=UPI0035263198